jgi:regulator of cell morphogenesis and NO signaling
MKNQSIINPVISNSSAKPDYIFYKFDSLLPGNEFIINDYNDPQPLSYLLLQEKGYSFSWEYLEIGPKKWCIRLGKNKEARSQTLGEMAVSDHRKALILRKYGLDFSFNGKKTLREACAEKSLPIRNIEKELNATGQQSLVYTVNYNSWEPDYLADFIVTNHHQYTQKVLLCIEHEWQKTHQHNYAYLKPLFKVFDQLHSNMQFIMLQEEQILFPYIRFLVQATKGKIGVNTLPAGSIADHINRIELAHQTIGEQLEYIRNFTSNFTMPRIEYSFYVKVLQWLNELDNDLRQHIHIEKNILFPKAIALEQEYLKDLLSSNKTSNKVSTSTDYQSAIL